MIDLESVSRKAHNIVYPAGPVAPGQLSEWWHPIESGLCIPTHLLHLIKMFSRDETDMCEPEEY